MPAQRPAASWSPHTQQQAMPCQPVPRPPPPTPPPCPPIPTHPPNEGVAPSHAKLGVVRVAVHAVELQPAAVRAAGQQAAVGGGRLSQIKVSHLSICL